MMVWNGYTTHPSNCTLRCCSKLPQNTQNLLRKIEMCRPSPHNWKTNPLEGFRQIKNQCYRSLISFSCMVIKSVHLQQSLPHGAWSSSIAPIRGTPPTFSKIFTLPQIQRNFGMKALAPHFCFCLRAAFSISLSFKPGIPSSKLLNYSFLRGFVVQVLHLRVALPMF